MFVVLVIIVVVEMVLVVQAEVGEVQCGGTLWPPCASARVGGGGRRSSDLALHVVGGSGAGQADAAGAGGGRGGGGGEDAGHAA